MGIRVETEVIVGNILGSPYMEEFFGISLTDINLYCKELRGILPDFVFFDSIYNKMDVDWYDLLRSVELYKYYCKVEVETKKIYLLRDEIRIDRQKVNLLYPSQIAEAIEMFTDYWVWNLKRVKSGEEHMYLNEWLLEQLEEEKKEEEKSKQKCERYLSFDSEVISTENAIDSELQKAGIKPPLRKRKCRFYPY